MKKTLLVCVLLIFLLSSIALAGYAHSGRTDGAGGHTDHSTGEYHYHHGYPPHDHYDIDGDGDRDCPYDFDDNTNAGTGHSAKTNDVVIKVIGGTICALLYIFVMFILPFLLKR